MATREELSVGTHVKVFVDGPAGLQPEGVVVAINDPEENPGKVIGLRLSQHIPIAHECDGLCENGHGWWTLPENIAVVE